MNQREIKYTIIADNQTAQGFNATEQQAKKTSDNVNKEFSKAAKSFGEEFKKQASGIGQVFKTLMSPINFILNTVKDIAKFITTTIAKMVAFSLIAKTASFAIKSLVDTFSKGVKIPWLDSVISFLDKIGSRLDKFTGAWRAAVKGTLEQKIKSSDIYKSISSQYEVLSKAFMRGVQGQGVEPDTNVGNNFIGKLALSDAAKEMEGFSKLIDKFGLRTATSLRYASHAVGDFFYQFKKGAADGGKILSFGASIASFGMKAAEVFGNMAKQVGQFIMAVARIPGIGWIIAGVTAGALAAVVAFKNLNKVINEAVSMGYGAQKIGISISMYKGLDDMLKKTGSSIQDFEGPFSRLAETALNAAKSADGTSYAFKTLGVNVKNANGSLRPNAELLNDVLVKLSRMKDETLRNSLVLTIFGKQGKDMIPMLNEYGVQLEGVLEKYKEMSPTLNKLADNSKRVKDAQSDMGNAWDDAKASLFEGTIKRLGDTMNLIMNSGFGEFLFYIGKVVMWLANLIIDAFNVAFGTVTVLFNSLRTTILVGLQGIFWLMNKVATNPQIGIMYNSIAKEAEKAAKQVVESEKQIVTSLGQLGSLGIWTGPVKPTLSKPTGGGSEIVPPDKTQKAAFDASAMNAWFEARKKYEERVKELSVSSIVDETQRKISIVEAEYVKELEIYKNYKDAWVISEEQYNNIAVGLYLDKTRKVLDIEQDAADKRKTLTESIERTLAQIQKERLDNLKQNLKDVSSTYNDVFREMLSSNKEVFENLTNISKETLGNINPYEILQVNTWVEGLNTLSFTFIDTMQKMKDAETPEEKMKSMLIGIQSAFTSVMQTISQVVAYSSQQNIAAMEKQKDGINEWYDTQRKALDNTRMSRKKHDRELAKLDEEKKKKEDELTAKIEEERKKQAKAQLLIQLFQAIGSTALGVTNALASSPPPLNFVMAGIVGAMGALQIGLISSQLSKFANGGIVGGNSYSGDNNLVRANSGEMILTKSQQAELFNMAKGKSGSQPTSISMGDVYIEGNASQETIDALNRSRSEQLSNLKGMLEDLKFQGELNYVLN